LGKIEPPRAAAEPWRNIIAAAVFSAERPAPEKDTLDDF
jgi:hypothetical protein